MAAASSHGPPVADLLVSDLACRVDKYGEQFPDHFVVLELVMGRQGPHGEVRLLLLNVRQLVFDLGYVNQCGWCCEPEFHESKETLASSKDFRVFFFVQKLDRLVQRTREEVIKLLRIQYLTRASLVILGFTDAIGFYEAGAISGLERCVRPGCRDSQCDR